MSNLTVKFLGKEYFIPSDVLIYVGLIDFTNKIRDDLLDSFKKMAWPNVENLESSNFMITEFNNQASKFIRKLLDNGVFDRTTNDYLKNNKGYELFLDTKTKIVNKIIAIRKEKLETYRTGVENAIYRKESSVTGLDFGIISNSFVNHMIYAYMDASEQTKQEKEALKVYNREITELDKQVAEYDRIERTYIFDNVIPAMSSVFTYFAYELLDRYISDLIRVGKFDNKALNYIDLERSNDLLKNLDLSNNSAIIENAFIACPFNIAVYMQAMKYDLLDYDSFQTAKMFKQDHHILSFFGESWGDVSYPTKFDINYHCINLWASLAGKTSAELLRGLTERYTTGIVKAYSRVADMISNKASCRKIIGELREDVILSGGSVCIGKAREYVEPIVHTSTWEQLTEKCGHTDLLSRIQKCFLSDEELQSKKDFDRYVTEQLAASFEDVRKELADQIEARRAEEERQRIERERQAAEQARTQAEKKAKRTAAVKKGAKRTLIVVGCIVVVCIALLIAGIIFLFATDKPIDNDFAERKEYALHSLTYFAPENWEEDFEYNQSNENTKIHVRYDNWGKFVCMMGVVYHGETQQISIEDVVSDYASKYKDATTKSRQIGEQEFTVISYVRTDDYNGCNVYVTESESSVFEICFRYVPESTNPVIFDEIVGAFAFDTYMNPKESSYNEALGLMADGKYEDAYLIFAELGGYKNSTDKMSECENIILESQYEKAIQLIEVGNYENAYKEILDLGNYKDCPSLLQNFSVVYQKEYIENYAGDWKGTYLYTYDSFGRLLVKDYKDGTMVYEYTYDDNHLISMVLTMDSGKTSSIDYYYDNDGFLTRTISISLQGELTTTEYYYNDSLLAKTVATDDDGSYEITIFSYDANGQLIKKYSQLVNQSHPEGYPYETIIEYSYDKSGHMLTETWTFDDGYISVTEFVYDAYGYLIKEIQSDGDDIIEYKYDDNHFLISKEDISDGEVDEVTEYSNHLVFYAPNKDKQ